MSKKFNPQSILDLVVPNPRTANADISKYDRHIISIMISEKCLMSEAMALDFDMNMVDKNSVFDMVDYLEEVLPDMKKISVYMSIYTGALSDFYLNKN